MVSEKFWIFQNKLLCMSNPRTLITSILLMDTFYRIGVIKMLQSASIALLEKSSTDPTSEIIKTTITSKIAP